MERGTLDRGKRLSRAIKCRVVAVFAVLIPPRYGLHQLGLVDARLVGQLLDGVRRVAIALARRLEVRSRGIGHHLLVALVIQDVPRGLRHGQVRPFAAELHVAVAAAHVDVERVLVDDLPVVLVVGIPVHEEATAVFGHGDAELLRRAHGHVLALDGADARPHARAAIHVPHVGADAGADVVAVAGVHAAGDAARSGGGQVVGAHLLVVLETAAAHYDALVGLHVHGLALIGAHAAENGLALGVLDKRGKRSVQLVRDVGVFREYRVHELDDVVVLFVLEVQHAKVVAVRQLGVLGVARIASAGMEVLGRLEVTVLEAGQAFQPCAMPSANASSTASGVLSISPRSS